MKKLILFLISFLAVFGAETAVAQEILIYKHDKTVIRVPFSELDSIVSNPNSNQSNYEFVDLGLPSGVLWADRNVGANAPEEYGDYFAWGEIQPKASYDESNSLTDGKSMKDFSGNPQYDAATANWGAPSRMPTLADIQELIDNCTTTWTTQNGVNGYLVTSKKNGNSIFFPAAGCRLGVSPIFVGEQGLYWSSSPYEDGGYHVRAYYFNFRGEKFARSCGYRDGGSSVRPVSGKGIPVPTTVEVKNISDCSADVSVSFTRVQPGAVYGVEYQVGQESAQEKTITVNQDGTYTVSLKDLSASTTYSFRAFVKWNGQTVYGESKSFTTAGQTVVQWVDLGLPSGILWADRNVGANAPEGYGDYFAWGETQPKAKYDSYNSLTYGKTMNEISGNAQFDAATANCGTSARMPTQDEILELMANCTMTWTTQNGVNGHLVTSKKNGNSIFLPAAGYRIGESLYYLGDCGFYWSSTPGEDNDNACHIYFRSDLFDRSIYNRSYGLTVRPVRNK